MELVFRSRTIMIVKIKGVEYTFYRNPHGVEIVSEDGQKFKEDWLWV